MKSGARLVPMAVMASELRRDYQCFKLHVERLDHLRVTDVCRLLLYDLEYDGGYAIQRDKLFHHLFLYERLLLQLFGISFSRNIDVWEVAKQH